MEYLVNAREMKNCDKNTIEFYKMSSDVLMERAALAVVEKIRQQGYDTTQVLVVCVTGNNGGDGVAVARILYNRAFRRVSCLQTRHMHIRMA